MARLVLGQERAGVCVNPAQVEVVAVTGLIALTFPPEACFLDGISECFVGFTRYVGNAARKVIGTEVLVNAFGKGP